LAVTAGPPSLLYNHLNRSFRWGRGLFDLVGALAAPLFSCSEAELQDLISPGTTAMHSPSASLAVLYTL
jgi:hypothetical protein